MGTASHLSRPLYRPAPVSSFCQPDPQRGASRLGRNHPEPPPLLYTEYKR